MEFCIGVLYLSFVLKMYKNARKVDFQLAATELGEVITNIRMVTKTD